MTLVKHGCVCGLCETSGQNINYSAGVFPRILQALDLNKLPTLLTEEELRQRIGLCANCETKIKFLEEAANLRNNLKECFVSSLKHLSGYHAQTTLKSNNADCRIFNHTFQQNNEITPDQHSIKRKISSIYSMADSSPARRKQLKAHVIPNLPISPASVDDSTKSSDEENVHTITQMSPLSEEGSDRSYTPPYNSKSNAQNQVLSELTSVRNRRKQARPSKASGEVLSAGTEKTNINISNVADIPLPFTAKHEGDTRICTPSRLESRSPHVKTHSPRPDSSHAYDSSSVSNPLPNHNTVMNLNNPLFQSMFSSQNLLLAHALSTVAAQKSTMMTLGNQMALGNHVIGQVNPSIPFNKNMLPMSASNLMNTTSAVKKEPSVPVFNYGMVRPISPAPQNTSITSTPTNMVSDLHTLVKTDKRRYCKVCAASSRKANNGRPPQSRSKTEEDPDSKASASALLLRAVKMKDKAGTPNKPSVNTKSISTPPSNSSLIYGPPSFAQDMSTETPKSKSRSSTSSASVEEEQKVDVVKRETLSPGVNNTEGDDADDRLVIMENSSDVNVCEFTDEMSTDDQIEITPELANKTAAMLDEKADNPTEDEDWDGDEDTPSNSYCVPNKSFVFQSDLPKAASCIEKESSHVNDASNNIPMQKTCLAVNSY